MVRILLISILLISSYKVYAQVTYFTKGFLVYDYHSADDLELVNENMNDLLEFKLFSDFSILNIKSEEVELIYKVLRKEDIYEPDYQGYLLDCIDEFGGSVLVKLDLPSKTMRITRKNEKGKTYIFVYIIRFTE